MKKKFPKKYFVILLLILFASPPTVALFRKIAYSQGTVSASQWNVSMNNEDVDYSVTIVPGGVVNDGYTFSVVSNSEVDVGYSIVVDNIPNNVQIKLDNGEYQTPTNNEVTFSNVDTILYSDINKERIHTVTFKALSNASTSLNNEININVEICQVLV